MDTPEIRLIRQRYPLSNAQLARFEAAIAANEARIAQLEADVADLEASMLAELGGPSATT